MLALTAGGCGGALVNGLYLLDTPRETYFTEHFDHWHDERWTYAWDSRVTTEAFRLEGGRFIAVGPRQQLLTNEPLPGHLEVWMDLEVWYANQSLDPQLKSNGDVFDFRVLLDTSETFVDNPAMPSVQLKLYDTYATPTDVLAISSDAAQGITSSVSVASTGMAYGSLRVVFSRDSEPPAIHAAVYTSGSTEPVLQLSEQIDAPWSETARVLIDASGRASDPSQLLGSTPEAAASAPRVLDTLYILPPEASP
jgi:hypothetical protein